jgi:hypothetical protein
VSTSGGGNGGAEHSGGEEETRKTNILGIVVPVWDRGGCQVEEQGRGPGSRQWLGVVEVGAGRAAQPRVRGGIGEGARGPSGERKTGRAQRKQRIF